MTSADVDRGSVRAAACQCREALESESPLELEVRREALLRSLCTRLMMCSHDELRIIDVIAERILKLGRDSYAPLDLARDATTGVASAPRSAVASGLGDASVIGSETVRSSKSTFRLDPDGTGDIASETARLSGSSFSRNAGVTARGLRVTSMSHARGDAFAGVTYVVRDEGGLALT